MEKIGILAFGFGRPWTILSNRRIAQIASQKSRELKVRVYTQLDVRVENDILVDYIDEEPGNPPPTLRIARGAVQWAKQHGLTELLIIAAKPHLWRALRDVQRAVNEAGTQIKLRACKEIERYPKDSWFCPESTQERIRYRKAWNKREKILRLVPFFIYKRLAS